MSKFPSSNKINKFLNKINEFLKNFFAASFLVLTIMIVGFCGGKEFEDRKDMDIQKKEWQEDMQKLDERLKRLEEEKPKQEETKNEETNNTDLEKVGFRTITCYSSTPEQTDNSPFITASGQHVRNGIIATNEFPFGTKLMINGNVYEVQDRTNSRYQYRIDIWKPSLNEALQCGVSTAEVYKVN